MLPVCLLAVKLVYCDDERKRLLLGHSDEFLSTDFHSLLSIDHEDTALANLECRICTADKVVGSRSVDEVELGVLELCIQWSCINRPLVEFFEFVVVRYGVLFFDCSSSVNDLAFIEHRFGKSGFSGFCGAYEHHVPDVFGRIFFHCCVIKCQFMRLANLIKNECNSKYWSIGLIKNIRPFTHASRVPPSNPL